ncbi:MAG: tyrosine-type recombinase/integrase [Verrucomicrobiota bacterium]
MAKLVPGLRKRGDWYHFDRMVSGVRIRKPLGTKNLDEAIAKCLELNSAPSVIMPDVWGKEVEEYISDNVSSEHLSHMFAPTRKYQLIKFGEMMNIRSPADVTEKTVANYYERLKAAGIKSNTSKGYIYGLRSFYRWLMYKGHANKNPALALKLDRTQLYYNHPVPTVKQRNYLLDNAPQNEMGFILYMGFEAGLRKSEIIECNPSWLDMDGRVVNIRQTENYKVKDRDNRIIPMTKKLHSFLSSYPLTEPYILRPDLEKGSKRYRYEPKHGWELFIKKQKKEYQFIKMQTLRHTFASHLVQAGVSIYKVAKWLGDGVEVVENHYGHLTRNYDPDIER